MNKCFISTYQARLRQDVVELGEDKMPVLCQKYWSYWTRNGFTQPQTAVGYWDSCD